MRWCMQKYTMWVLDRVQPEKAAHRYLVLNPDIHTWNTVLLSREIDTKISQMEQYIAKAYFDNIHNGRACIPHN